jgi:hypothetical protein
MSGYPILTGEQPGGLAFNASPANDPIPTSHPVPFPGTIMIDQDARDLYGFGARTFKFVQWANDSNYISPNVGDVVVAEDAFGCIATANLSNSYINKQTGNANCSRNAVLGVVQNPNLPPGAAVGISPGNYSWIQTTGYHPGINTTGTAALGGQQLIMSATNQEATTIAIGTAPTFVPIGVCLANATVNSNATFTVTGNSTPAQLFINESLS